MDIYMFSCLLSMAIPFATNFFHWRPGWKLSTWEGDGPVLYDFSPWFPDINMILSDFRITLLAAERGNIQLPLWVLLKLWGESTASWRLACETVLLLQIAILYVNCEYIISNVGSHSVLSRKWSTYKFDDPSNVINWRKGQICQSLNGNFLCQPRVPFKWGGIL